MFETYIYAPFFNILVGIYLLLGGISPALLDMGIAVIVFSLIVKLILFPLTLASERSEEEKKKIADKIIELKRLYAHEPIRQKEEIRNVMRSNMRSVIATSANLGIGLAIILMLYRIFSTGLGGADFHLLYDFIPQPGTINLLFLGKYDLTHTNLTLNALQSLMIFVVEVLIALRSPFPLRRKDKALLQIVLPIGSFFIFMFLPSGKKLFVITSLAFSALYNAYRLIQEWGNKLVERMTPKPPVDQHISESATQPASPSADQSTYRISDSAESPKH